MIRSETKLDESKGEKEQEQYEEKHRYDDFEAVVHYDSSYKRDFFKSVLGQLFYKKSV